MAAAFVLRGLGRARPALRPPPAELLRAPRRGHRLTPADDELYQRTHISVLQREAPHAAYIESYSSRGFVVNGNRVLGPCALLPHSVLQWNVGSHLDITEESLSLFWMLEPPLDLPCPSCPRDRGGGHRGPHGEAAPAGTARHEAAGPRRGGAGHAQRLCHFQLPVSRRPSDRSCSDPPTWRDHARTSGPSCRVNQGPT
ncbi:NADH dehydrogenase [ubiquinone] 1 alpha subcomplex assembly factor 3 isoform X1 [Eptesicus fuscus]|uniref:NADH dehydrogenase [ubiquinone] 1 alpha subcomplex assembly factor 3 isoform X1 n=1 Tax=Eptesicus fuscus TaxID=29078 RepID=UPI001019FA02|nr:NADH dehydrogenase [ubiquinone] 1 alpha subcomplex assembly factor 3 isoform X1 [Eptesicus fuscus]